MNAFVVAKERVNKKAQESQTGEYEKDFVRVDHCVKYAYSTTPERSVFDMSTTQTPAGTARPAAPAQPSAAQQLADSLNRAADAMKTPQQRLDSETGDANQSRADAAAQEQRQREDQIRAHARQQQAINQQNQTRIKQNDFVVVNLDQVPNELHTVSMRESLRNLRQAGAHLVSGRVSDVEDTPTGREYVIETASRNYIVPAAAVTRADIYADENDL